jgi:hypothetical protein
LRHFHKAQIHPHPTNDSGIMVTKSWERCQFQTDQTVWTTLDLTPTSKRNLGKP